MFLFSVQMSLFVHKTNLDKFGLATRGCGFESRLRQELSTTEVTLEQGTEPPTAPRAQCRLLTAPSVCVHLDGLNVENIFHCWLYSV